MSRSTVLLRYDGPALAGHKMDVRDLAPALLAFGNLCREANRVINGSRASVRVLVNADINANCVTVSFDVVWSLYEQAKALLSDEDVASAKNILEWIGLIGTPASAVGLTLFRFLRAKGEAQSAQEARIVDADSSGSIQINITGDGNTVLLSPEVAKLASDARVVEAAKGVIRPVAMRPGIDTATFQVSDGLPEIVDKHYAASVLRVAVEEEDEESQVIIGHIKTHSPVFEASSGRWRFEYNGQVENIDISETSIAADIMQRGKIIIGDTWKVKMRVIERKTKTGFKNDFKVTEVLDFFPGNEQSEIIFGVLEA